MDIEGIKKEKEPTPKDISAEFLKMESYDFLDLLETLENEPALSIKINWDYDKARRLKAFLEDRGALGKQKRTATVRATKEQYKQGMNFFASGVKWEEVDNKTELEPTFKDISVEFLNSLDQKYAWEHFVNFLRTQQNEPSLSIKIDWKDIRSAQFLKTFLDDNNNPKQKRSATIRATKEQYEQFEQELNVFASGVK